MVTEIRSKDLQLEAFAADLPVIVYFMSLKCHACFALGLVVDELSDDYDGRVQFIKLDITIYPEQAEKYDIKSLPALLLLYKSAPAKKLLGFWYKSVIKDWLEEALQEQNLI